MNTSSCGFYFCSPFVNVKNRILKNNPFQRSRILPRAPDPQQCSWSTRGQLRMVSLPDSAHTAGSVPAPAPPFPAFCFMSPKPYRLLPPRTQARYHTYPSQAPGSTSLQVSWLTLVHSQFTPWLSPLSRSTCSGLRSSHSFACIHTVPTRTSSWGIRTNSLSH